jgi:hypothetical protein
MHIGHAWFQIQKELRLRLATSPPVHREGDYDYYSLALTDKTSAIADVCDSRRLPSSMRVRCPHGEYNERQLKRLKRRANCSAIFWLATPSCGRLACRGGARVEIRCARFSSTRQFFRRLRDQPALLPGDFQVERENFRHVNLQA